MDAFRLQLKVMTTEIICRFFPRSLERVCEKADPGGISKLAGKDNHVPTILIVEDEPHIRQFLLINLNARQYDTLHAGSAEEGLQLLKMHAPPALILDLKLPGMNGWSMLSAIDNDPTLVKPMVIIITASSSIDLEDEYPYPHIVEKLAKPLSVSDLLRAVGTIFR